jgi:hypothetical protein
MTSVVLAIVIVSGAIVILSGVIVILSGVEGRQWL